jgi:hypothetical protein
MKRTAEGLHSKWEEKLSTEMQPFILDIDDWNASYPDAQIRYEQVIPVDRVNLPKQQMDTWATQAGDSSLPTVSRSGLNSNSSLLDFFSVYAPSADNNSPSSYAAIVANDLGVDASTPIGTLTSRVDEFAKAIAKHEGFTSGASRLAVQNNNPGNLRFIGQAGAVKGESNFAKFATVEDGWRALRNDILAKIGTGQVDQSGRKVYSLVPTAEAASPDDTIYIEGEIEEFTKPLQTGGTLKLGGGAPMEMRIADPVTYRNTQTGKEETVPRGSARDKYLSSTYYFKNVADIKNEKPAKPIVLAGKTLPQ